MCCKRVGVCVFVGVCVSDKDGKGECVVSVCVCGGGGGIVFACVETPPSRTKPYSWGDFCSTMRLEENYCFVRKKTD